MSRCDAQDSNEEVLRAVATTKTKSTGAYSEHGPRRRAGARGSSRSTPLQSAECTMQRFCEEFEQHSFRFSDLRFW